MDEKNIDRDDENKENIDPQISFINRKNTKIKYLNSKQTKSLTINHLKNNNESFFCKNKKIFNISKNENDNLNNFICKNNNVYLDHVNKEKCIDTFYFPDPQNSEQNKNNKNNIFEFPSRIRNTINVPCNLNFSNNLNLNFKNYENSILSSTFVEHNILPSVCNLHIKDIEKNEEKVSLENAANKNIRPKFNQITSNANSTNFEIYNFCNGRNNGFMNQNIFNIENTHSPNTNDNFNLNQVETSSKDFINFASCFNFEYYNEIFLNSILQEGEIQSEIKNYLEVQKDLNSSMREIVVNWLILVQLKQNLKEETIYICINIIDRFLSGEVINRSDLQLIGICALSIAIKFEEIKDMPIKLCLKFTGFSYSKEQFEEMQSKILRVLKFNIFVPTSINFLDFIFFKLGFSKKSYDFSLYLLNHSITSYEITINFLPSVIARASIYLTLIYFDNENKAEIIKSLNFDAKFDLVLSCSNKLNAHIYKNKIFNKIHNNEIYRSAVREKFSHEKYSKVALM